MSDSTDDDSYIPLGLSKEEGGGVSLSSPGYGGNECPSCGDGYISASMVGGGWGSPSSPLTEYCRNCGATFELRLVQTDS